MHNINKVKRANFGLLLTWVLIIPIHHNFVLLFGHLAPLVYLSVAFCEFTGFTKCFWTVPICPDWAPLYFICGWLQELSGTLKCQTVYHVILIFRLHLLGLCNLAGIIDLTHQKKMKRPCLSQTWLNEQISHNNLKYTLFIFINCF